MFLHNLLNVLVQIANKMGLQQKKCTKFKIHIPNDLEQIKAVVENQEYMAEACDLSLR
jgi:hypothetical protein